jgi:hypothetical protein
VNADGRTSGCGTCAKRSAADLVLHDGRESLLLEGCPVVPDGLEKSRVYCRLIDRC